MSQVPGPGGQPPPEPLAAARLLAPLRELDRLAAAGEAGPPSALGLSEEDERAVARLRSSLAALVPGRERVGEQPRSLQSALDGAEFVTRGEIMAGGRRSLPRLLPGFAFLVVLPLLGRSEALRLSRRATVLLVDRAPRAARGGQRTPPLARG